MGDSSGKPSPLYFTQTLEESQVKKVRDAKPVIFLD